MSNEKEARWKHVSSLLTRILHFCSTSPYSFVQSDETKDKIPVIARYARRGLIINCTEFMFPDNGDVCWISVRVRGRLVFETSAPYRNQKYRVVLESTTYVPGDWEALIPELPKGN